jgi:DNA polymerase-3 subunit gamma/tau
MIEASESEAAALKEQSERLRTDALTRILEVLTDCEGRLRDTTSKKILVEVALLKMIEARDAVSIDTVLQQIQQLRAGSTAAPRLAEAPASAAKPKPAAIAAAQAAAAPTPAPVQVAAAPAGDVNLEQLWRELVEAVGRANPFVKTYFVEAHPVSFVKNVLTIGFDPEFADHLLLVDNSKNQTLVKTKLAEMGYAQAQVRFVRAEAPPREKAAAPAPPPASAPPPAAKPAPASESPKPAPQPAAAKKDDFKNDPLIQKALEVFKGQIVEVRS